MSGYKDSMYWASPDEVAEWRARQQAQQQSQAQVETADDADRSENGDELSAAPDMEVTR